MLSVVSIYLLEDQHCTIKELINVIYTKCNKTTEPQKVFSCIYSGLEKEPKALRNEFFGIYTVHTFRTYNHYTFYIMYI